MNIDYIDIYLYIHKPGVPGVGSRLCCAGDSCCVVYKTSAWGKIRLSGRQYHGFFLHVWKQSWINNTTDSSSWWWLHVHVHAKGVKYSACVRVSMNVRRLISSVCSEGHGFNQVSCHVARKGCKFHTHRCSRHTDKQTRLVLWLTCGFERIQELH